MSDKMGGPAFPSDELDQYEASRVRGIHKQHSGMLLWDCFAAAALAGLLPTLKDMQTKSGRLITENDVARQVGYFADAMLEERAKRMESGND